MQAQDKKNSVFALARSLGLNKDIITTNLILILKDISIYKEVYKTLKSKPHLLHNLYSNEEILFHCRADQRFVRQQASGGGPASQPVINVHPCSLSPHNSFTRKVFDYKDLCFACVRYTVQKNLEELIASIKN